MSADAPGGTWQRWFYEDAALMDEALASVEAVTVERIAAWLDQQATNPAHHPRDGHVLELTEHDLYGIRVNVYLGIANALRSGDWQSPTESPTRGGSDER